MVYRHAADSDGDLLKGTTDQKAFEIDGVAAAPLLCYEDLFASEIREWWQGGKAPNLLVNLSNLGWFGDTHALPQHLNISRMRAMEFARPVIRATNTGMRFLGSEPWFCFLSVQSLPCCSEKDTVSR